MRLLFLPVMAGLLLGAPTIAQAEEPYCREYTKKVIIDNKPQEMYGDACLQPDGSWKMVSERSEKQSQSSVFHEAPPIIGINRRHHDARRFHTASGINILFNLEPDRRHYPKRYRKHKHHNNHYSPRSRNNRYYDVSDYHAPRYRRRY